MVRRLPSEHRNAPIARDKDNDAIFRLALLLIVGLVLACGFVYAGRQHIAALRFGYETEKMRNEREHLAEQQRRLILEREEAASPVRLEQAAKRLGMRPLQPAQIDPLRQGAHDQLKQNVTVPANNKPLKREAERKTKPATKPAAKSSRKPI